MIHLGGGGGQEGDLTPTMHNAHRKKGNLGRYFGGLKLQGKPENCCFA